MALEMELATYKEKLPELAQHQGKYALVHGSNIVDVYGTYEDALKGGGTKVRTRTFHGEADPSR
jgi:hypothetical protein